MKANILDTYLIDKLLPTLIFSIVVCSILSELIGISFEQIKFVVEQDLPVITSFYVHLLKLPAFITVAIPLALLMATIFVYSKLSATNKIVALQSFGINLYRLIFPAIAIASYLAIIVFIINEAIVPPTNYQAAMLLEREWNVDRGTLAKYNKREIVYQEFSVTDRPKKLELLFFAEMFDGKKMINITIIKYHQARVAQIINAESATWSDRLQKWQLNSGLLYEIDYLPNKIDIQEFDRLSLSLSKNILDYANSYRDNREMNIFELYQRLAIIRNTDNPREIRQLKIDIQDRYTAPASCLAFSFLGCALGINSQLKTKGSNLGIAAIAIFGYYSLQFITHTLAFSGAIDVFWGTWFPTLFCLSVGCLILHQYELQNILDRK